MCIGGRPHNSYVGTRPTRFSSLVNDGHPARGAGVAGAAAPFPPPALAARGQRGAEKCPFGV